MRADERFPWPLQTVPHLLLAPPRCCPRRRLAPPRATSPRIVSLFLTRTWRRFHACMSARSLALDRRRNQQRILSHAGYRAARANKPPTVVGATPRWRAANGLPAAFAL